MNRPYKGKIEWMPDFIGEELMNQQELQGNKRDISVFEKNNTSDKNQGGFDWDITMQKEYFGIELFMAKTLTYSSLGLILNWKFGMMKRKNTLHKL